MDKTGLNDLSHAVIGAAIEVHRHLGPGLLEGVYHRCFIEELKHLGFAVQTEVGIPIRYKHFHRMPTRLICWWKMS